VPAAVADRLLRGEGSLQMQVSPPELGTLDLEVRLHEGALFVSMCAESPAVMLHLEQHLSGLTAQLQDAGLTLGGLEISSRDARDGQPADASGQGASEARDASASLGSGAGSPSDEASFPSQRRHRGVLDVIA
jgi:flagellar hook-length control protein FliK